jgi:hypothetical protein
MAHYLENTREVSEIKNIMKLDGSGQEHLSNFMVQSKWCCNNVWCQLHHCHGELVLWVGHVLWQDRVINGIHSLRSREAVRNTPVLQGSFYFKSSVVRFRFLQQHCWRLKSSGMFRCNNRQIVPIHYTEGLANAGLPLSLSCHYRHHSYVYNSP